LRRLVGEAVRSEGRLVLVGGEAGIGKTALVDDAARYAAGDDGWFAAATHTVETVRRRAVDRQLE
jgi:MoxR-like ATPase